MNIKILRKAINVVYLNYYGNNISNLCVDRIINYYKQFTKDARRESNSKNKGAKAVATLRDYFARKASLLLK